MAERLFSLTYVSRAVTRFDSDALASLLSSARATNQERELTGMLLYRGGRFLQVLEGREVTVRRMIDRIRRDPRHADMRVVAEGSIDRRVFGDWTMGYQPIGMPSDAPPEGFRDSFADLDSGDAALSARVMIEIAVWFRARSARSSPSGDDRDHGSLLLAG